MNYKKKSSIPENIAALLPDAVANANVFELAKVRRWWMNRFKDPLRSQALPHAVEGSRLIVHVTSSTWLQELHYLRPQIVEEIRRAFPRTPIFEVVVRIGELPQAPIHDAPETEAAKPRSAAPMSEEFARALSKIQDDALRAAISNRPSKTENEK